MNKKNININENTFYTFEEVKEKFGYSKPWFYANFSGVFKYKTNRKNGKISDFKKNGMITVVSGKDIVRYFEKTGKRGNIVSKNDDGIVNMDVIMDKWVRKNISSSSADVVEKILLSHKKMMEDIIKQNEKTISELIKFIK